MTFTQHYKGARKQDWRTPMPLFQKLHDRFAFTMDGAATATNALLPRFNSARKALPWGGERVYCNPPWNNIRPFVKKAPAAALAVLLVPARCNAAWFHEALALGARVEFFPGRPSFTKKANDKKGASPFDCCLLIWGG